MARSNSNASDPFAAALRLLTRRDRSEAELRDKLSQFGFSASAIDATLERCRACNYLDDRRYALHRARALIRTGRGVGKKVLLDLQRRGIDAETAEQALAEAMKEHSTQQLLVDLLDRRFPGFDFSAAEERERRRVISYLQRRGFPLGEIFSALNQTDV